jgi:arsenate reductase
VAGYILFVCTENAARSQMAEAFFNAYNENRKYAAVSAGTRPAEVVKELAVRVMAEKGIDIDDRSPKRLRPGTVLRAEMIITMGCLEACPASALAKSQDWQIEDPSGKTIEVYRRVRDDVERRVKELVANLA